MMGRFGQCNGPFWTIFLEIKILGAVLVGAVLAMGRFGIDPTELEVFRERPTNFRQGRCIVAEKRGSAL